MHKIVNFKDLDKKEYQELVESGSNSTPFHQYDWLSIVSKINSKYYLKVLCYYKFDKLIAAMPFMDHKYLKAFCISGISGTYGGLVYTEWPKDFTVPNRLFSQINLLNSSEENYKNLASIISKQETFILDINREYDVIIKSIHQKTRNQIRKSEKSGITIARVSNKYEIDSCYKLYLELGKKHSIKNQYSKEFIQDLISKSINSKSLVTMIAKDSDKVCGFAIFIVGMDEVFYFMSSFDPQYSTLNPINGLLNSILKDYCLKKKTLNFGAVPPDNSNLKHFKDRWSAKSTFVIQIKSYLWYLVENLRRFL